MKFKISSLVFLLFIPNISQSLSATDIYANSKDSIFQLHSLTLEAGLPISEKMGSGVAISPNILITNCHVLSKDGGRLSNYQTSK